MASRQPGAADTPAILGRIRDILTVLDKRAARGQAAQAAQRLPFQEYCFPAG